MAIKLHCTHCGKVLDVPEEAGGKWGKCPGCASKIYIPSVPDDDDEEIGLVPLDEEEERRAQKERAYFQEMEQRVLLGEGARDETSAASPGAPKRGPIDLVGVLARYVQYMAQGRMADCEEIVAKLLGRQQEVAAAAKQLLNESPQRPQIRDVPAAVVKGYLKQLLGKL